MTIAETAVFLGCSRHWVRSLIGRGVLPATKRGRCLDVTLEAATGYWVDVLADRGNHGRWAVIDASRPQRRRLFDDPSAAMLQALTWGTAAAPCKILDRKCGRYLTPPPQ
jgi:excisionase family DNA binding protein